MYNYLKIVKLLHTANVSINHPKIRLRISPKEELHLKLAGAMSRYDGHVILTDGAPYGSNIFYGYIDKHIGTLEFSRKFALQEDTKEKLHEILNAFQDNPAETAALYGKETGSCCFCGLTLTDPRSVGVGYGPICAGHYNLPWGDVTAEDYEVAGEILEQFAKENSTEVFPEMQRLRGAVSSSALAKLNKTDDELLEELQKPATLEDAIKQIAELRELCWNLQRQVDSLYHRNR